MSGGLVNLDGVYEQGRCPSKPVKAILFPFALNRVGRSSRKVSPVKVCNRGLRCSLVSLRPAFRYTSPVPKHVDNATGRLSLKRAVGGDHLTF
jgi:hypothetical protein